MQVNGALTEPGKSLPGAAAVARGLLSSRLRGWIILREGTRSAWEKVHVNPGGGPDRDDTGLPPVDVEIPDDARELDRDVQAYHRELRAQRRRSRSLRLHGVLGRDGMVMPLLICCLVFALITGTLLTLFTSTSIDQRPPPPGAAPTAPGQLASARVRVAGHDRAVNTLGPAILLVPPPGCRCAGTISQLAGLAARVGEPVYLVVAPGTQPGRLGPGIRSAGDVSGVLTGSGYRHAGLTAILVTASRAVSYQQRLRPGPDLQDLVDRA
jgi:hypothetical protein